MSQALNTQILTDICCVLRTVLGVICHFLAYQHDFRAVVPRFGTCLSVSLLLGERMSLASSGIPEPTQEVILHSEESE